MNSGFGLDELKRELDHLNQTRAQEQSNVDSEEQELNQVRASIGRIEGLNRNIQSVINDELRQVMELTESNCGALLLENLSKIETELAKLGMARDEQREATEKLNKEFQETLDVLDDVRSGNADRHKNVKTKIDELEKLALEREAEVQRLKVEKECVRNDMTQFQKKSSQEMELLLKQYNELHAEMMKKKYAPAEYSDNDE